MPAPPNGAIPGAIRKADTMSEAKRTMLVSLVTYADGSLDVKASILAATQQIEEEGARETADFDTAEREIRQFFLAPKNVALRSMPIGNIVDGIMSRRVSAATRAFLAENPDADDDEVSAAVAGAPGTSSADKDRLASVLPAYFRQNPDQFHMGRRSGVSIRYVNGDVQKDQKTGKILVGDDGQPSQRYRFTDEEWAKLNATKPETTPAAGEGAAAEA